MIKGEVISFDRIKGYGFVAPESGGDDVFIHVNDLYGDKNLLSPGCIVEFRPEDGVRGLKASEVTVIQPAATPASTSTPIPAHTPMPAATSIRRVALASPTTAATTPEPTTTASTEPPAADFEHEITEALLRVEPELTSRQIIDIRARIVRIARAHDRTETAS